MFLHMEYPVLFEFPSTVLSYHLPLYWLVNFYDHSSSHTWINHCSADTVLRCLHSCSPLNPFKSSEIRDGLHFHR